MSRIWLKSRIWVAAVAATTLALAASSCSSVEAQQQGSYTIRGDHPQQIIRGLGFEIQSDSIGSGNSGMPDQVVAVPHDLTPSERTRFYKEMLHGFRYTRLAMGLYLRGTDTDQKHIIERYPGQMHDLRSMQDVAGIEGFDVEYWSPAPFWKQNKSYYGGTIGGTDPAFLNAFSDAMVQDLRYLHAHGLRVAMWGLQNEPGVGLPRQQVATSAGPAANHSQSYATCFYTPQVYALTLSYAAPKVRALLPQVQIQSPSWDGGGGAYASAIRKMPGLPNYVDAWTWHQIGHNSNDQIVNRALYMKGADGKPVYENEFEYQPWSKPDFNSYFMNTGQSLMNWMVFENSPTWFWIHALKPVTNLEAKGYALGFWRPEGKLDPNVHTDLKPGHWEFNPQNWNAIAGFLKYLPWDSTRLTVDESTVSGDQRILVWRSKTGVLGIALSNRGPVPYTFHISGVQPGALTGHRYTLAALNVPLGQKRAKGDLDITVAPQSFEFWIGNSH